MAPNGKIDAAAAARLRETQLTEIAQGDIPKLTEALVNRDTLPGGLTGIFQVAVSVVDSDNRLKTQEVFNQQQQQKTEQQQQDQEKKDKEAQDNWLDAMSPEYRQAYAGLMDAIGNADKEYAQDKKLLKQHRDLLEADGQDIDDKAIHLSDGSRAYLDGRGKLVDKNGAALKGKNADEAQSIFQQRGGNPANFAQFSAYQQNNQAIAKTDAVSRTIDANQIRDHKFGTDATDPEHPDVTGTQQHTQTVTASAAAITATTAALAAGDKDRHIMTDTSGATVADFPSLDGDDASATASAPHSSFASTLDPSAGIKANSLTVSFSAAVQTTNPVPKAPTPLPRPAVSAPAPT